MSKHTRPGPWTWDEGPGQWKDPTALSDGNGDVILYLNADLCMGSLQVRICDADVGGPNLKKIEAVPDLLEACKALVRYDDTWTFGDPGDDGHDSYSDAVNCIRAAIAKAENGDP